MCIRDSIYTEDLKEDGDEAGSMLETFFSSKKGYDVHFATAAVLMFRYYGIPARYAEGYQMCIRDRSGICDLSKYDSCQR